MGISLMLSASRAKGIGASSKRAGSHPDRATKETIAMLSFKGVTKYTKLQIKERMKSSNKRSWTSSYGYPTQLHTLTDHA